MEDDVGAAEVAAHELHAGVGSGMVDVDVGEPFAQQRHVGVLVDRHAASEVDDVVRLLELVMVGSEDDGLAVGYGLENVVYAHAEATADIGHGGVAVEFGEDAYVVDDEDLASGASWTS